MVLYSRFAVVLKIEWIHTSVHKCYKSALRSCIALPLATQLCSPTPCTSSIPRDHQATSNKLVGPVIEQPAVTGQTFLDHDYLTSVRRIKFAGERAGKPNALIREFLPGRCVE